MLADITMMTRSISLRRRWQRNLETAKAERHRKTEIKFICDIITQIIEGNYRAKKII